MRNGLPRKYFEFGGVVPVRRLTQADPENIADYFSGQIFLQGVDQNVQVTFQCKVDSGRSRQYCIWLFSSKEKIMFNVVLIFLGQDCTGKSLVQCCPRASRQHCTAINLFNVLLRGSRQHCKGSILFNVVVILLGQHCTGKNLM